MYKRKNNKMNSLPPYQVLTIINLWLILFYLFPSYYFEENLSHSSYVI